MQFALTINSYTDSNSLINFERIETFDKTFLNSSSSEKFNFLTSTRDSFWVNPVQSYQTTHNVSIDLGKSYKDVSSQIVLGIYFFLNEYEVQHTRKVLNIFDVLSEIGGLANSLIGAFGVVGAFYNSYVYAAYFVHLLYFVRKHEIDDKFVDDNDL